MKTIEALVIAGVIVSGIVLADRYLTRDCTITDRVIVNDQYVKTRVATGK